MRNGEDFTQADLALAEEAIGHRFRDQELLKTCFTHKSYSNARGGENNERLEFLGDAVIELCITEKLYKSLPEAEGRLTELRQKYVSQTALEQAAERAGIKRFLRYSGGENNVGGKTASNLFEAVVGGLYLDGGLEVVRSFLAKYLELTETENYKTLLQEYVQERTKKTPVYNTVGEEGGKYLCTVSALEKRAQGWGESKKAAETAAAKQLYLLLTARCVN